MYPLMKAQALVINHQKQEAEWILEEFKREWPDHHTPEWGYYLYIMTLLERETQQLITQCAIARSLCALLL